MTEAIKKEELTKEELEIILKAVQKCPTQDLQTAQLLINIANESAELIGLEETPKERMKFLETLLNDYVVLTR